MTRPMSDLCWMCQQNSTLPVEEKSEVNIIHVHYFIKKIKIIMIFVSHTTDTASS